MDGTAIIVILAIAGVASVLLFALKGLLDQLPDIIDSAGKARRVAPLQEARDAAAPGGRRGAARVRVTRPRSHPPTRHEALDALVGL